jgi:hypothetical protein
MVGVQMSVDDNINCLRRHAKSCKFLGQPAGFSDQAVDLALLVGQAIA